jgi:phosphatidylinositol alpha-1,6-mannosyltransferase
MHLQLAPLAVPLLARGAPVGVFLHGVEAWRRLTAIQRFVVARAQLIANSRWTAEQFRQHNPSLARRPIDICPLGIEAGRPPSAGGDRPSAALIVSRLTAEDRYKGVEDLIRAWPGVRARVPSAELLVVGDGDDRSRLEALGRSLAGSAIRFAGSIGDEELAAAYSNCAFFVLPSDREGFGLVFLEAMRAGKACVSGPGAPAELVQDGVSGYVVATGDAARLTDVLVRLFEDGELRARFGATGRSRLLQAFTLDRFESRFRDLVTALGSDQRCAA